jgi:hypothetical protein
VQITVLEAIVAINGAIDNSGYRTKWGDITGIVQNQTDLKEISFDYLWTYIAAILPADPGVGNVAVNNVSPGLVTELYISSTSSQGIAFGSILNLLGPGTIMQAAEWGAITKGGIFKITSSTDNGGWYTFGVQPIIGGSDLDPGESVGFNVIKLVSPLPINIYASEDALDGPQGEVWIIRTGMVLPVVPAATYEVNYSTELTNSNKNGTVECKVELDGAIIAETQIGTDEWRGFSGLYRVVHPGGPLNLTLSYRNQGQGDAYIRRARLILKEL